MKTFTSLRSVLLGTVLSAPFAVTAGAQQIQINDSALTGLTEECQQLAQLVKDRDPSMIDTPREDIVDAINTDTAADCTAIRTEFETVLRDVQNGEDSARVTEEDSERVTEEVDLSEEATIEGEAVVTVPEPEVDVRTPAPRVRVTEQQPRVAITDQSAQIELEQERPRIAVEIPEIIVSVDIPAPKLYVLQQEPQVEYSEDDPQVEVMQGEPQIRVSQADPELNVDLDVEAGEGDEAMAEAEARDTAEGGQPEQVSGDVDVAENEPQVEIVQAEGGPELTYNAGEPNLSFEQLEPAISVTMAEQPTIRVQQSGEATVVVETEQQRQERRQQQQAAAERPEGQAQETAQAEAEGGATMPVSDLMVMEVVTADGAELGAPAAFVELQGRTHLVVENGGFLGIGGKEVPVPMQRVSIDGDQLLLDEMTEQEIEAANNFTYDENRRLADDQQIRLGS